MPSCVYFYCAHLLVQVALLFTVMLATAMVIGDGVLTPSISGALRSMKVNNCINQTCRGKCRYVAMAEWLRVPESFLTSISRLPLPWVCLLLGTHCSAAKTQQCR